MFEHAAIHNAAQSKTTSTAINVEANHAGPGNHGRLIAGDVTSPPAPNTDNDEAGTQQRTVIDQIDLSLEASARLERMAQSFQQPVFQVQTSAFDVLNVMKPAFDEAQTRMNRDAFIILSMMGLPPAKAREMANDMTGGAPQDMLRTGSKGRSGGGAMRMVSQSINIDLSQIETRFSGAASNGSISISEFRASIQSVRIDLSQVFQQDPLILDLDGNGIDTTDLADGVLFDIDGDGTAEQTAWVTGHDALLALDRNGDGIINDGTELFGDQNGAVDGFAELAKYDDNQDGVINRQDNVFSSLVLLRTDGSQSTLAEEGIQSISLSMVTPVEQRLAGGDMIAQSSFSRDDGSMGKVGEVLFDVKA
ncbi:hypothetical protein LPB41_04000 [Thalassospira sp. MA62]|nr:hypothetical protein [Thalassospira sp. MA62]